MKRCTYCQVEKPEEAFSRSPMGKGGRQSQCKGCLAAKRRGEALPKVDPPDYVAGFKTCTQCQECKPLGEFSRKKAKCRTCLAEQAKLRPLHIQRACRDRFRAKRPYCVRVYAINKRASTFGATGRITEQDLLLTLQSQDSRCNYCRKELTDSFHVDHKVPLSKGGNNTPGNICISCPSCNVKKGNKSAEEYRGVAA